MINDISCGRWFYRLGRCSARRTTGYAMVQIHRAHPRPSSMLWVVVVLAIVLLREEIDRSAMLLKASSSHYMAPRQREKKLSATNTILQLKDAYSRPNLIASCVHKLLLYGTAEKVILYQTHSLNVIK